MALFDECMLKCARKLDTADIVERRCYANYGSGASTISTSGSFLKRNPRDAKSGSIRGKVFVPARKPDTDHPED